MYDTAKVNPVKSINTLPYDNIYASDNSYAAVPEYDIDDRRENGRGDTRREKNQFGSLAGFNNSAGSVADGSGMHFCLGAEKVKQAAFGLYNNL